LSVAIPIASVSPDVRDEACSYGHSLCEWAGDGE